MEYANVVDYPRVSYLDLTKTQSERAFSIQYEVINPFIKETCEHESVMHKIDDIEALVQVLQANYNPALNSRELELKLIHEARVSAVEAY